MHARAGVRIISIEKPDGFHAYTFRNLFLFSFSPVSSFVFVSNVKYLLMTPTSTKVFSAYVVFYISTIFNSVGSLLLHMSRV